MERSRLERDCSTGAGTSRTPEASLLPCKRHYLRRLHPAFAQSLLPQAGGSPQSMYEVPLQPVSGEDLSLRAKPAESVSHRAVARNAQDPCHPDTLSSSLRP